MADSSMSKEFRPAKKRKIYRQRDHDSNDEDFGSVATAAVADHGGKEDGHVIAPATASLISEEVEEISMADVLRMRRTRKIRGGVAFGVENKATSAGREEEDADGRDTSDVTAMASLRPEDRFQPQTGTVLDVNKHMMAYIDSAMAQRHAQGAQEISRPQETTNLIPVSATIDPKPRTDETGRLPTSHGKLQEIDLGDEARSRNIKETERAQRMLRGDPLETDMDDAPTKPVKVRLGPDGKPWRSRRKRRASEDLKRDLLVDAVLRENRLEIYDTVPNSSTTTSQQNGHAQADDENAAAADDRLAEEFRQEFFDSMQQRRKQKKKPVSPPRRGGGPGGKREEEVLKGPKLGGSRNTRQAMRDAMLKAAGTGANGKR